MRELLQVRLKSNKNILEEMMPPSWHIFEKTAAFISSLHSHRCVGPRATVDAGAAEARSCSPEDTIPSASDLNINRQCGYYPRIQQCEGRLIYVVSQMEKPSIQ